MPLVKKTSSKKTVEGAEALRIFSQFGVEVPESPNASGQFVCDCIFCDREEHLFISLESKNKKFKGEGPFFTCKSCGLSGNKYTFLKAVYEQAQANSKKGSFTRLGLKRKQPAEVFTKGGVVFSPLISRWLYPAHTREGGISNLHAYDGQNGSPWIGAPGCNLHLLGLEGLKPEGPVAICEGHWDRLTLMHMLTKCQKQPENWSVLAAPGCDCLPESDIKHLVGRDVYLLYDNDEAGYRGMKSAVAKLHGKTAAIHVIEWPPNRFKDGYDVSDYFKESDLRSDDAMAELLSWCHRTEIGHEFEEEMMPLLERTTIEEVIADFRDTNVFMYPGLKDALILSLGVILSIKFKGEPLWMQLIGVSGCGKSLVLDSTLASRECLYRTAITHRSLISGFSGGDDPSLLAKVPGKGLVVKDYSNVLSLPAYEQDQLFSLLREAYDGRVYRDYGNGVIRQYPVPGSGHEDCRFSFVAGVTPDIYARSQAALGERFLRFHIPRTGTDDLRAIEAAIDDSWRSSMEAKRRAAAVAGFLSHVSSLQEKTPPSVPEWYKQRIISLAQFVGYCRSHVSRTKEDLDYAPAVESGTRMAKQLFKLTLSLCRVMGKRSADKDVYRLVRKVAWDTAHGWRRDIYQTIYRQGHGECSAIVKSTGLSRTNVWRQLRDMHSLGVLKKGAAVAGEGGGRPNQTYLLSQRALEIYETAKIGEM